MRGTWAVAVAAALLLFFGSAGCRENRQAGSGAPSRPPQEAPGVAGTPLGDKAPSADDAGRSGESPALKALGGYPYPGPYAFVIRTPLGSRPVSERELVRYHKKYVMMQQGGAGHKKFAPEDAVRSFAIFWASVEAGIRDRLDRDAAVRSQVMVYRSALLSAAYHRHLMETVKIPEAQLEKYRHSEWVRMDFGVRNFDDQEAADKFSRDALELRRSKGEKEYAAFVDREYPSSTGPVFRGSGFFDADDDAYLFGLKQGEISRPVRTGIGLSVVYVKSKEDMDARAVRKYLDEWRGRLVRDEVQKLLDGHVRERPFLVNKENLVKSALEEGTNGYRGDLVVLTLPGDDGPVEVRYRDFRTLYPAPYAPMFKSLPRESWGTLPLGDLDHLGRMFVIGEVARKKGLGLSEGMRIEVFDFESGAIYAAAATAKGAPGGDVTVSAEEAKRYFDRNRGQFSHDAMFRISYLFNPEKAKLDESIRKAGGRESLFRDDKSGSQKKQAFVTKSGGGLSDIYEKISKMKQGDVSEVVKGGMGYYVVKMDERREKGFYRFDEVETIIRRQLAEEKAEANRTARVKSMMTAVRITRPDGSSLN